MFHVFLSAGIQPSALMGLIRGSDYESLQQALGTDCKSALGCDSFLMRLHVNPMPGIDSAMCGSCSRIITWTGMMCRKLSFEFYLQDLCL